MPDGVPVGHPLVSFTHGDSRHMSVVLTHGPPGPHSLGMLRLAGAVEAWTSRGSTAVYSPLGPLVPTPLAGRGGAHILVGHYWIGWTWAFPMAARRMSAASFGCFHNPSSLFRVTCEEAETVYSGPQEIVDAAWEALREGDERKRDEIIARRRATHG